MATKYFFISSLILAIVSCGNKNKNISYITNDDNNSKDSIFNYFDSIPTGVPQQCIGKIIHQDSVMFPKSVSVDSGTFTNAHTNKAPLTNLSTFPYKDSLINIDIIDSSLNKQLAIPTIKTCKEFPSTTALPMKFMESAQYDLQYIDVDEGLHSSYLWDIIEDSRGYLWFASHDAGVAKYDGHSFSYYTVENGLCANSIRSMFEDSKGNIWFASKENGVSVYTGNEFENYNETNGLTDSQINVLFEDSKGNIWLGTNSKGVIKYDGKHFTNYTQEHGLSYDVISSICELDNGDLWFGAWGGGITAYDGTHFSYVFNENGIMKGFIRTLLKDNQGNIWVGNSFGGGVLKYDGKLFTQIKEVNGLLHNTIFSITEGLNGEIWIASQGGVSNLSNDVFTHFTKDHGLRSSSVRSLLPDSKGNIWIGTWGGGAHRLNTRSFYHFKEENGLPNKHISSITEDLEGNIWTVTRSNGVAKYDGKSFENFTVDHGLVQNGFFSTYADTKGNIWFGGLSGGLNKYDGNSITTYTKNNGLSANGIFIIKEDQKGNLWMGTNGGGVCMFDGERFTHYKEENRLSDNIVRAIAIEDNGTIWIGTWSMGICKLQGDSVTYITKNEGLSSDRIFSLEFDNNGTLWVGTDMGIDILNSRSNIKPNVDNFEHMDSKFGLSNNTILAISNDSDGNLWLNSKKGLNHLILNNDASQTPHVQTFVKNDGLISTDFYVNCSFVDSKNRLWAGSGGSLVLLDLKTLSADSTSPITYLKNIQIGQEFIDFKQVNKDEFSGITFSNVADFYNLPLELELPYHRNHLTFDFSSIYWSAPNKIKYSYKIDGLNENWSNPSDKSSADYRNLPYGNYTLKVKSKGENNLWSSAFEYDFTIHPPWWHTWWARFSYIIIGVTAIFGFIRWRTNKLRKQQLKLETDIDIATKEIRGQKDEMQKQKEIIEEAHKEITDSIAYAKRIQNAILPPAKIVKEYLKDSFILYKPKDVVAGDFYWMEHKDGKVLFAAADCTGHGVPGAMVSVVCNNGLNRSVREHGLTDPGKILDKTREIIIQEFEKSEEEVKDGMDIALCSLEGNVLKYAGAHNPLWILRNGEILETKANKQPIGKFDKLTPYTTHTFELEKGDTIYIFSDGYVDQFGGERGKKFKSKAFRELLLSIQNNTMEEQRILIDEVFEKWRGDLEQIDDVCVIGVRI